MIDHFTVSVVDLRGSRAFYERVLRALGYELRMDFGEFLGFGDARKPYFWLKQAPVATTPQHIAFSAPSREAVDAFHQAALEAGARDDGSPGVRADYHPNYYAAFIIDPLNGHPVEAVFHGPQAAPKKKAAAAKAKKGAAKKPLARGKAAKKKSKR